MIRNFKDLIGVVKNNPKKKRIIVVAAQDLHTLQAINRAYKEGLVETILIGDKERIIEIIEEEKFCIDNVEIINEVDIAKASQKAVKIIKDGRGDVIMKGAMQTSELLKEVVNKKKGLQKGGIISHVGLFQFPAYSKLMAITDGGMVIAPNVEEKKQIIANAVYVLNQLGNNRPKVAVLSANENENSKVQSSVDGAILKRWNLSTELEDCIIEGPISFDLMFDKESAKIKGYKSSITGDTDICLVPDMVTGNLMGKAIMYAGEGQMAGIVVGALVPIVLVSRSATASEKYLSLVLASAVANGNKIEIVSNRE